MPRAAQHYQKLHLVLYLGSEEINRFSVQLRRPLKLVEVSLLNSVVQALNAMPYTTQATFRVETTLHKVKK